MSSPGWSSSRHPSLSPRWRPPSPPGPALERLVEQLPAAQATALRLTVLRGLSLRSDRQGLARALRFRWQQGLIR